VLSKSPVTKPIINVLLCCLIAQSPALAELNVESASPDVGKVTETSADSPNKPLVAQANNPGGAADISAVAAVAGLNGKRQKHELLITDSLWGNLILDLAYQRDEQLRKISKRMGLINAGTTLAIAGIAGGTVAQGIIALSVLNPPDPKSDSYLPGSIGVGMSGLTLIALGARTCAAHAVAKQMRARQLEIKHRVEAVLAQIEQSQGQSATGQKELVALIGERATNEWLQLWRSNNKLAFNSEPLNDSGPAPPKVSFTQSVMKESVKLSANHL